MRLLLLCFVLTLSLSAQSECQSSVASVLDRLFLVPGKSAHRPNVKLKHFSEHFKEDLYSSKASALLWLWLTSRYQSQESRIETVETLSVYLSLYMTNKNEIWKIFFEDFFKLSSKLWRYTDEFIKEDLLLYDKVEHEEKMKLLLKFSRRYKFDFESLLRGIHVISNERDRDEFHDLLLTFNRKYSYIKKEIFEILKRVRNKNMREMDYVLLDALTQRQIYHLFDCSFNPLVPLK